MIQIMIVDDHQVIIDGLSVLLPLVLDCQIVGSANSGASAIEKASQLHPQIIIMDIVMPGIHNGIQAIPIIKEQHPTIKVLSLSMMTDATSMNAALEAGADGYIVKNASGDELKNAIQLILQDNIYIHPSLLQYFLNGIATGSINKKLVLTRTEKVVLKKIVQGATTKDIADTMFRSEETIRTHRKNLLRKFNCKNAVELVGYAIRNYLV